jgi:Cof subfamily protein (haloacid dehalogenase superfamily)
MSIKIVFFDIDWTLYDHKNQVWVPSAIEAIKKLQQKGLKVILSTARPFDSLKKFGALNLGVKWDGYIACAGGVAVAEGKTLYKALINDGNCRAVISKCEKLGLALELVGPLERKLLTPETQYMSDYYKAFRDVVSPRGVYEGDEVISFLLFAPSSYDDEFARDIPSLHFFRFFDCGVDVMQDPHEKGPGIDLILKHFGLKKEEALGFGDDTQDLSMAEHVGHFVCMGNGKDELKAKSEYVTAPVWEDGVYKGLRHFKLV